MGINNVIFITMVVLGIIIVTLLPEIVYLVFRRSKVRIFGIKLVELMLILLIIVAAAALYFVIITI